MSEAKAPKALAESVCRRSPNRAAWMGNTMFERDGNLLSQLLLYAIMLLILASLMIAAWQTAG
ncbi:hypothetical protein EAS61_29030 [Bradyrhizobium zhanjiangense]|uniref:Uncharacterized protein n=1 Tax=Bradyrhizobium zhanjiangense TaxID=1325107 RepID=A0A4Q0QDL0_9BRAD|nr:hypothetical protein EAS61_29030 [Bradyrhizobium zhanjiangense]